MGVSRRTILMVGRHLLRDAVPKRSMTTPWLNLPSIVDQNLIRNVHTATLRVMPGFDANAEYCLSGYLEISKLKKKLEKSGFVHCSGPLMKNLLLFCGADLEELEILEVGHEQSMLSEDPLSPIQKGESLRVGLYCIPPLTYADSSVPEAMSILYAHMLPEKHHARQNTEHKHKISSVVQIGLKSGGGVSRIWNLAAPRENYIRSDLNKNYINRTLQKSWDTVFFNNQKV